MNFSTSQKVGIFALEGYSLMSFASATEPFRAANLLSGQNLYDVQMLASDVPGASSQGSHMVKFLNIDQAQGFDLIFVIAGGDPFAIHDRALFQWLRGEARQGARLCGVSGGPVVLAMAGLMDGFRMTVHWEHAPKLQLLQPNLLLGRSIYIVDRGRLTCAGGIAAFDMVLALIAEQQSADLAEDISNWFLHTAFRQSHADQVSGRGLGPTARHSAVVRGLRFIQNNLGEDMSEEQIAAHCNLSVRQLSRLFKADMRKTPMQVLREQRMDLAKRLLQQTGSKVSQVAMSSGFNSTSHFSTAYRQFYGKSPSSERMPG